MRTKDLFEFIDQWHPDWPGELDLLAR